MWAVVAATALVSSLLLALLWRWRRRRRRRRSGDDVLVGFFHPGMAQDGGGGERVLWCAVAAVQQAWPHAQVAIYAGLDGGDVHMDVAARANDLFGTRLLRPVKLVPLKHTRLLEPQTWPRFTLIGQSLGSMVVAWEALASLAPDVFIDTAGHAFTYPVARWAGCSVVAYVHYPLVSSDMIARVRRRQALYNNAPGIASSLLASSLKLWYYRLVAALYGAAGRCAIVAMANSSWTRAHIASLWGRTPSLELPLSRPLGPKCFISVAQFRPEKAHGLQLEAFRNASRLARAAGVADASRARLVLVGSCRHVADQQRLEDLHALASTLGIADQVDFHVNVSYEELKRLLGASIAGLHTMTDEHFGISVVEYMAAGAVPIAHNSGGPRADIVLPEEGTSCATGFLAASVEEFSHAMLRVLTMSESELAAMAAAARRSVARFSVENFTASFLESLHSELLDVGGAN
eukprot:jgi/Chlat1/7974/Chrsp69S07399